MINLLKGKVPYSTLHVIDNASKVYVKDYSKYVNYTLPIISKIAKSFNIDINETIKENFPKFVQCGIKHNIFYAITDEQILELFKGTGKIPISLDNNTIRLAVLYNGGILESDTSKVHHKYQEEEVYVLLHEYIELMQEVYGEDMTLPLSGELLFELLLEEAYYLQATDLTLSQKPDSVKVLLDINKRKVKSNIIEDIITKEQFESFINYIQNKSRKTVPRVGQRRTVYAGFEVNERLSIRATINYTIYGHTISIRLHPSNMVHRTLKELNIHDSVIEVLHKYAKYRSGGIRLFCGETNSGKNTAMYSTLNLYAKDMKIVTVEEPVEQIREDYEQISVIGEAEWRDTIEAVVRVNPDVLVIGEIKDRVTSKAALEVSNQGKPVYSTIHCNSASDFLDRLVDLTDYDYHRLITSVSLVIHQTLLPNKCPICLDEGCDQCYKSGMTPIIELIEVTSELKDKILNNPSHASRYLREATIGRKYWKELVNSGKINRKVLEERMGDVFGE